MSRTYRDYPKQTYCLECGPVVAIGGTYGDIRDFARTLGYCLHKTRPWTRQHDKRPYKYRNPGKHQPCCGSSQQWRYDIFWLRFDVLKSEGV